MPIKVIVTGVTGMVGEGVLHECLRQDEVQEVLVIGRRPSGIAHPKLKEIVHSNLFDLSPVSDQLKGYQACFFCLGTTSVGKKEPEYKKTSYDLTLSMAQTLKQQNPDLVFCYVSGAGTDSTEKGKVMWARVKGKTENDLVKLFGKNAYNFRPGIIQPTKGLKNTISFYKYLGWLIPVIRMFSPRYITSLKQLGSAMLHVSARGYPKNILEIKDILAVSK